MMLLLACLVMAAEGYFLPPLGPAQPPPLRGQPQGSADFYPEFNKIEENVNYNNRFLYQSPNYQQFSDSQRYYSQQAAAGQQAYGTPLQQLQYQQPEQLQYQQPEQLQYQQPEQLSGPVYSDIRDSPIYIQPHDEETTRQQTLTITPQYLNLPAQHQNAIPQSQQNFRGPQPGLHQTTAQTTIPVLVRVSDNQALIVPVRAVYALPGFLERLVQRVQGHYSVYNNPIDNLVVDQPYFVPTTNSPTHPSLQVVPNAAENSVDPMKADLVQDPAQGSSESLSSEVASPVVSTKIDLRQDEIKDETTTAAQSEDIKEGTTESGEESKDSTEKEDSTTESSETNDTTTMPSSASADVTTASPSASADDTSSTAEISSTTETASSTTEAVSPTTEGVSPTTEGTSTSKPAESAGDSSDLESAGYTYYRPAVPFYYPTK